MPIVPAINTVKSIKTGAPYSPSVSFNPDKKQLFDTQSTTLGVLAGGPITTDGVNITIPTGFTFIQNGIIVKLTAPFVILIPGILFPKFIVADNVDETPGSAVTIEILGSITPPQILCGTITPNNSTIIQARQISIRALAAQIDAAALDIKQDAAPVQNDASVLNFIGPNALATSPGPGQVDLTVKLDIKEGVTLKTTKTEEISILGVTIIPVTASKALVDARLLTTDEGIPAVTETRTINFRGGGVTATVDGGDPKKANVDIPAGGGAFSSVESVMGDGIIKGLIDGDGGTRQINVTSLFILRGGQIYGPFTTTVAVTTNVSGTPRTDLVQFDGISITVKVGTPGVTFPCPSPDAGNIPLAVILVPTTPSNLVDSINKQSTILAPVLVAHYYANGGLHASRVGVVPDPSTSSATYIDADEMALSVYFPRVGYRYELNWDTVVAQALYGFLNEGALVNMSFDGVDEDDDVVRRGNLSNNLLGGVSIHGWEKTIALHYQRLITVGSHLLKGRWKVGQISTPETLSKKRRRIWIVETA